MTTPRWEQVKRVLEAALALPPEKREEYVRAVCGDDDELRREVSELITAAESADDAFLDAPTPAAAGDVGGTPSVLGEFDLVHALGKGAMGVVYLALQRGLDRRVAVKVLRVGLTTSQRDVDRFQREARAAARLKHPGIVPIYSVGHHGSSYYFSMEFVPAGDLAAELERLDPTTHKGPPRSFPARTDRVYIETVARRMAELAEAVHYAHQNGVVHRDIKPLNILLGDDGTLRLVDFGLAKDATQGSLSLSGQIIGTPHYMSPEQASAKRHEVDQRTDVYSLGAVLYEMLTGHRPFRGKTAEEVISQVLHRQPEPVRRINARVPRDLATICGKAMEKRAQDRYGSADELAADLRRFLAFEAIRARAPSLWRRTKTFARKRSVPLAVVLVLLLGLVAGSTWSAHAAERRAVRGRIAGLEELARLDDWSGVDDERLRRARRELELLRVSGTPGFDVEALERRFDDLRDRWVEEGRRTLDAATDDDVSEGVRVDDTKIVEGLVLLLRALAVFPEDAELRRSVHVEMLWPRVTLRAEGPDGNSLAGRASYRPLDQVTGLPGPRVDLGGLPLVDRAVEPGFHRFRIEVDGHPAQELSRIIPRGARPTELVHRVRGPERDPHAGMRLVEGAVLRIPAGHPLPCPLAGEEIAVEPFWIDVSPVSLGEYRAYLAATGAPPPAMWSALPSDARYDDRPAVLVSWYDARRYAEWAGKRLVSHAEWELAARGPEGWSFTDDGPPDEGPLPRHRLRGAVAPWHRDRGARRALPRAREPGRRAARGPRPQRPLPHPGQHLRVDREPGLRPAARRFRPAVGGARAPQQRVARRGE